MQYSDDNGPAGLPVLQEDQRQEALALLQILEFADKEIEAGEVYTLSEVMDQIRTDSAERRAAKSSGR